MTFDAYGVVVGAGPELIDQPPTSNLSEYCGDVTVDVSLSPATITITGGENYCNFQEAYVEITLHGAEFSSTTLISDGLFEADFGDKGLGAGGSYKSRGLHFALTDPYPVLDSYGVSGNLFAAYWSGGSSSNMSGVSTFAWVPAANAAVGAGGLPAFTG